MLKIKRINFKRINILFLTTESILRDIPSVYTRYLFSVLYFLLAVTENETPDVFVLSRTRGRENWVKKKICNKRAEILGTTAVKRSPTIIAAAADDVRSLILRWYAK